MRRTFNLAESIQPIVGKSPIDGCVALFDLRSGVDVILGQLPSANTGTRAVDVGGAAYDYSTTANTQFAHHPDYAITGAITAVAYFDIDALTGYGPLVSKAASSTTHMPIELRLGNTAATDSFICVVRANAGGYRQSNIGTPNRVSAASRRNMVAVRFADGTLTTTPDAFVNGSFFAMVGSGGSGTGAVTDNGAAVYLGARQAGTTQLDGRIYWVALFNRRLDNSELQQIWAEPSIVFPRNPRNRSLVGVAAGGATGTVATTLADFTSSAAGTTTVTGTSAQTLADFTSSAAGTTTVTGTSAQTLADFTSTASGVVPAVGTVAATLDAFTPTASGSGGLYVETQTGQLPSGYTSPRPLPAPRTWVIEARGVVGMGGQGACVHIAPRIARHASCGTVAGLAGTGRAQHRNGLAEQLRRQAKIALLLRI